MAAGSMEIAAAGGRTQRRRRPVMSEINVTPFVDVMLVLLIVFMVSAPLRPVGVPIDLPQSQAKALEQNNEPLTISVNNQSQIFLQKDEIKVDDLLPKLKAIIDARGGTSNDLIYIRGDRTVAYGMMMRGMGRLSGACYHRIALVTRVEQGRQGSLACPYRASVTPPRWCWASWRSRRSRWRRRQCRRCRSPLSRKRT